MKNILCILGIHKLRFEQKAVAIWDGACCGDVQRDGQIMECKNCGDRFFKYESGVKINLNKPHTTKIIPRTNIESIREAGKLREQKDRYLLFGEDPITP